MPRINFNQRKKSNFSDILDATKANVQRNFINQGNRTIKIEPDLEISEEKTTKFIQTRRKYQKAPKSESNDLKSVHNKPLNSTIGSEMLNSKESNVKSTQSCPNIKSEPDEQFLIVLSPEKPLISSMTIKSELTECASESFDSSSDSDSQQLTNAASSQNLHSKNPKFKKFQCIICPVAVSSKMRLKKHIQLHSRSELNCKKCGKFLKRNLSHSCDRTCKICNKKFKDLLQYLLHMKDKHKVDANRPIFECDICGLKSLKKTAIALHMEAKHFGGKNSKFICDLDGKEFKSRIQLYYHIFVHMEKVNCKICGREVKPAVLRVHMKSIHNTEKTFKCQVCLKVLKAQKYLDFHMKTHDKKFECKICNKKFPVDSKLRTHIKITHEKDIKLFKCEKCSKTFKTKCSFTRHKIVHEKNRPKPFKCHKCDYSIDKIRFLNVHLEAHERKEQRMAAIKNPVKCETCQTLCKSEAALKVHIKDVHLAPEYECDLCGKKTRPKTKFRDHLRHFHKFKIERIRGLYKRKKTGGK